VSIKSLWKKLVGVEGIAVEAWDYDESLDSLILVVRPKWAGARRCPECRRRCAVYDQGGGRRRWRSLDLGTTRVLVEALAPRVRCRWHGVVVAAVPWARPGSWFTRAFEDQTAWLAVHANRTAVSQLMRIAWRTVGRIVTTVGEEARRHVDLLAGLRRIGIDEVSYRKGQKYLTVVVDHGSGRLVWMEPGRDADTVRRFFDALGHERTQQLEIITADGAGWIELAVQERAPHVIRCLDPFHVVQWATRALDKVRRSVWNDLRIAALPGLASRLKGLRWAMWKNPEDLTPAQRESLGWIPKINNDLYRAYLLKEALRVVFHAPTLAQSISRLDAWVRWARRSQLRPFQALARSIVTYYDRIAATIRHRISNALVEARNTQIRLLTRLAHGFKSAAALIGLSMLKLAGLCPQLPGRSLSTNLS